MTRPTARAVRANGRKLYAGIELTCLGLFCFNFGGCKDGYPVSSKLAIFALDGASPELIEQWAGEGRLPTLASLMERGAFGPLESTIPPVTGAAWGSFLSGVSPGRHGVFEWLDRRDTDYGMRLTDGRLLPPNNLFEHLSAHDRRVGVMSVPLVDADRDLDGVLVTDLLTPPGRRYAHPRGFQDRLERAIGGPYPVAPPPWPGRYRAERWMRELKASLEARMRGAKYALDHEPWDVFMVHVMETDSVQHQMWHKVDGIDRPRYRVDVEGNPVLEIYQQADAWIGRCLENLDEETTVMVISDHGFGTHLYNLHTNVWLLRQGFLRLRRNVPTRLKKLMFSAGVTPENLYPSQEWLRLLGQVGGEDAYQWLARTHLSTQNIDWSRTVAFSYGNIGQVTLNMAGREPAGIVTEGERDRVLTELEASLREWTNPETGEPVIAPDHLYRRAHVYGEPTLPHVPDLLFLPTDGYTPIGLTEFIANRPITHPVAHSGWHRLNGVFAGAGPGIASGRPTDLRLLDMYPTICALMGVPPPEDLDGRVLTALLTDDVVRDSRRSVAPEGSAAGAHSEGEASDEGSSAEGVAGDGALTSEEEAEIRERLKGLGYL